MPCPRPNHRNAPARAPPRTGRPEAAKRAATNAQEDAGEKGSKSSESGLCAAGQNPAPSFWEDCTASTARPHIPE
jgi:hypothetical protein